MKVLIAGAEPWNAPIPYYIAPQRIARALHRAGHEVFCLDGYGDPYSTAGLPPNPPDTVFQLPWGTSMHATVSNYYERLVEATEKFKPDLAYLVGWANLAKELRYVKGKGLPAGLVLADPFYWAPKGVVQYPSAESIALFAEADFVSCQAGQVWNYLKQHGLKKAHPLLHAVDPELAPTLEEVRATAKPFLCSMVAGGDDAYRRIEYLKYFAQWTDGFPSQTFVIGGSFSKGFRYRLDGSKTSVQPVPYEEQDLRSSDTVHSTEADVQAFKGRSFNLTLIHEPHCTTFPAKLNPMVLCHRFIHRVYAQSLYGFTPFGWYMREGPQSEYNCLPFSTKVTEQGGSGCANLVNRIRDIEQWVVDGKTGFILDRPEDGLKAFQYAVDNPGEVRRMGEEAWRHIHAHHSWDNRYREELLPIFRELGLI